MDNEILKELREIKHLLQLEKEIWTLDDFCKYTGISKPYAYHLTSQNKIKFSRPFGKLIFITREDALEFLKRNPVFEKKEIESTTNEYLLNKK